MNKLVRTIFINEIAAIFAAAAMSGSLVFIYNVPAQARYFFFFWVGILQLFVLANVIKSARAKRN
jgi:hypothetical protein